MLIGASVLPGLRGCNRYTLRPDGFISINAGSKTGELLTKPFTFTGEKLELNLSTSAVGGAQVEMQNADGTPIPGFALGDCPPVYGDALDLPAVWQDQPPLASLTGKSVRLRFTLTECDLYAFNFS